MIEFSTLVLPVYVSPEVVQDLDGEDALYGIWTVFTKCKHLLKDGERLENLSWRLWYRELSLSHSPGAFTSGTSESILPSLSDADFPSALTPVSEDGRRPNPNDFLAVSDDSSEPLLSVPQGPSRHSRHGGGLPPPTSNTRQLSTASMLAGPSTRLHHQQPERVGSILTHILPEKAVYPSPTASRRPYSFPKAAPSSNPSTAKSSPMQTSAAST
ncbi:hypothetical protein BC629DRAFT_918906 [Irpex lacteus]|nr:hypothetical protein BC629DRAFT_918906 [Irpex lacteus]